MRKLTKAQMKALGKSLLKSRKHRLLGEARKHLKTEYGISVQQQNECMQLVESQQKLVGRKTRKK